MLSTHVETTQDLLSIALQAEREAIRRYTDLSRLMDSAGNTSAASLFKRLIEEEEEHETLLLAWMKQNQITESRHIGPVSWQDPNIPVTYNEKAQDPCYSTPYRALAYAVHNEEIAFRFYTHVAANARTDEIREYAETLAREELGHAALLRAERRRAYHIHKGQTQEPYIDPASIHSEIDLLRIAIQIESLLLRLLSNMEFAEIDDHSITDLINKSLFKHNTRLNDIIQIKTDHTHQEPSPSLKQLQNIYDNDIQSITTRSEMLDKLLLYCDQAFSFYDAIVITTKDESIMLLAQDLSNQMLDYIAILKHALKNQDQLS